MGRGSPVSAPQEPTIFVIDDDPLMLDALSTLLRSIGLRVETFASATEFLQHKLPPVPSCLVLDIRLPRLSGFDLQAELSRLGVKMPIVFITGHGDVPMSVKAMKAGAVDFLTKPFRDQEMLDAVVRALDHDQKRRESEKVVTELRSRFETLTAREREVIALVADGLMNKQIAAKLGVSEITVKVHRVNMMRKMKARSVIDLVGMVDLLGIRRARG
jgi:FixJ family two-component response regulator